MRRVKPVSGRRRRIRTAARSGSGQATAGSRSESPAPTTARPEYRDNRHNGGPQVAVKKPVHGPVALNQVETRLDINDDLRITKGKNTEALGSDGLARNGRAEVQWE